MKHPEFAFSDEYILPTAMQKLYFRSNPRLDDSYFVAAALQKCLDVVISMRNPWTWCANSCHLDCWLMVELSFFGRLIGSPNNSNNSLLTDDIVLNSPALKKLFKVLLMAGSDRQDKLKMWYWAMEIEEYMGGSTSARSSFASVNDYSRHGDFFASSLRDHNNLDLRSVQIGLQPICNNPTHIDIPTTSKALRTITAVDNWYTIPDDWARQKDANGRWYTTRSHARPHANISDVMETVLGRTEGETTECTECASKLHKSFQITLQKTPSLSTLPLALEINVDPDQLVLAEPFFNIGGTKYTLLSVVFGNGAHFTCNVMLRGLWYHYDGLGMPSRQDDSRGTYDNGMPDMPVLVRAYEYMQAPPSESEDDEYRAIAYRYFREGGKMLQPSPIEKPHVLPTDLQFNSMWRLFL